MGALLRVIERALRSAERFALVLGFVGLAYAYWPLIQPVVQNGDAAVYTEQVARHAFNERAIHIGYMLLGSLFAHLPLQIDRAMNAMALTLGLGAAFALYDTAKCLGSRRAGLGGVLLLLGAGSYVRAMVLSEVDILSAALVMIAYALYIRKRHVLAGAVFGLAMLSTPVSATFVPLFVFTFALDSRGPRATIRRQFWRVLWFGVVALAVYAPIVAWQHQSYFFGSRSVTTSTSAPFNAMDQLERGAAFFKANGWPLLPLYVAGLLSALTDKSLWRRDQPAIGLLISLAVTALVADRASDVPVHLPALALLSLVTVLFLHRVSSVTRTVWAVPIGAFLLLAPPAYRAAEHEVNGQLKLRERYETMRERSRPLRVMLAGFPKAFSTQRYFEHYAYGISYTGTVPTIAELRRLLPELQSGPEEYEIYFVRNIPGDVQRALEARYQETTAEVAGTRFKMLTPRSRAH